MNIYIKNLLCGVICVDLDIFIGGVLGLFLVILFCKLKKLN